jgi:putative FmdB family regulatory protein
MPTYEYECQKCSHIQEEIHKMSEIFSGKCQKCGSKKLNKKISNTNFSIESFKVKPVNYGK